MNAPVSSASSRQLPDPDTARRWLAAMSLLRRFDERAGALYGAGQIGGFLHVATGEEAVIVGAVHALEDRDWLLTTFRAHAHALARGTEPARVMAELFGRGGGVCHGRGGAMHVADVERRVLGGFGLVGAHLPVAAGVAMASGAQGRAEVALAVLGDGAVPTGAFAESLGLAAVWNLPVVLLVVREAGGEAEAGAVAAGSADLHRRVDGMGIKTLRCDGMDVVDVHGVCAEAARIARTERRPVVVEALVRRAPTVSLADPSLSDDAEAIAAWKARDPLTVFGDRLVSVGLVESADRAREAMAVNAVVEQAVAFAGRSPHPDPGSLYDDVVAAAPGGAWWGVDARGTTVRAEADAHPREARA